MRDLLIKIITNASFIAIATLIIKMVIDKGLQKQKGNIDKELEEIKGVLQLRFTSEQEKLNQKRDVYIKLVDSMSIFLNNRYENESKSERIKKFQEAYDTLWLWGSDEVILAYSEFLKSYQMPVSMDVKQRNFAKCVLAMRKDLGYKSDLINEEHYEFFTIT
ncbi:hypothetical protein ASG61_16745 [Bacillus sp. Leaf75]|nr:hypothetical protein ASG61_16745 [Bacillus sp. Leaf75]